MQILTTTLFDEQVTITLDVDTSDDRAPMAVSPSMYQETIAVMTDGEDDGRGIAMEPDAYTAMGIAGALERAGLEVQGLEEAPPDLDGEEAGLDMTMLESAPRHLQEHFEKMEVLKGRRT